MRKLLLTLSLACVACATYAQSLQEKLYYTCKTWGFVKYYHSEVSMCNVNWDSVLIHVLPMVRAAGTNAAFNDALDTMLLAAGPMAPATTPPVTITDPMLKGNSDWSWRSSPVFRTDVQSILDGIANNFRPHAMCQVVESIGSSVSGSWGGWLEFQPDTIMLQTSMHSAYPDADHRMLMVFKMWNMMRYFNPYNYILTTPVDTTLYHFTMPFDNAATEADFNATYLKFVTAFDDAHVYGSSYMFNQPIYPGYYHNYLLVKYIEGQYVVARSKEKGIVAGDVIQSVDGMTMAQWEDSLMKYYSAGSIEIKHRSMAENLLGRTGYGTTELIGILDSTGTSHIVKVLTNVPRSDALLQNYFYPADTLNNTEWSIFDCNTGYINVGNITDGGTDSAYDAMRSLPGIVIDVRNYPVSGKMWGFCDKLLTGPTKVTRLTIPDVTYPGTYVWDDVTMGVSGNPTPYAGKVVVIVDEETQSAAEYMTMMLRAYPQCTVIGSHTAGADGNVTYMKPAQDMRFGWTSLGVFYPNNDSTQRVGIIPDVEAHATIEGIRHQRDLVLEKALAMAGCTYTGDGVQQQTATPLIVSLFPNPVNDAVTARIANAAAGDVALSVTDLSGRVLLHKMVRSAGDDTRVTLDAGSLSPGLYMLKVSTGDGKSSVIKFSKI